jgi:predicted Fe-Mo cluster-binding NifX family protein
MRIGVASDDGVAIAGHFGRCAGFEIFDIIDGKAAKVECRLNTNSQHHHQHQHHGDHDCGDHDHHGAAHGHESFLSALHDCEAVICRGMGRRAVMDLAAKGIKPLITQEDVTVAEAVELYAKGNLKASSDSQCCSH